MTSTANAVSVSASVVDEHQALNRKLRVLYCLSCSLSIFQIFWFNQNNRLLARLSMGQVPASDLPEIEAATGAFMGKALGMSTGGGRFFARGFLTKYHNQKFIGLTHILAAPIWAAIIPFQLHPGLRGKFRKFHRILGTVFFSLSLSLMAGFAAIMKKRLQLAPNAPYARGLEGRQLQPLPAIIRAAGGQADLFLAVSSAWFSYTLLRSWSAAMRRRFAEHEEWVLRHIGSGQWISLMRILQSLLAMPLLIPKFGDTKAIVSTFFSIAGMVSWVVCLTGAELAITQLRAKRRVPKPTVITKVKDRGQVADHSGMGA